VGGKETLVHAELAGTIWNARPSVKQGIPGVRNVRDELRIEPYV
jgi:hypothetical protein